MSTSGQRGLSSQQLQTRMAKWNKPLLICTLQAALWKPRMYPCELFGSWISFLLPFNICTIFAISSIWRAMICYFRVISGFWKKFLFPAAFHFSCHAFCCHSWFPEAILFFFLDKKILLFYLSYIQLTWTSIPYWIYTTPTSFLKFFT